MRLTKSSKIVAIDPGTHTGYAIRFARGRSYDAIGTAPILIAMQTVDAVRVSGDLALLVVEDTRHIPIYAKNLAKVRGKSATYRDRQARNVGMTDRDINIWIEYAELHGVNLRLQTPKGAKWTQDYLHQIVPDSKRFGRLNKHARDAVKIADSITPIHLAEYP